MMKNTFRLIFLGILFSSFLIRPAWADVFMVNSQQSFDQAHDNAAKNDSIIWESGTYNDIYMLVDKDELFIAAEELGGTIFNGDSKVRINGDQITFQGFQFVGGNVGTSDVISIYGSDLLITQININAYRSYKYLRIRESSQYVTVSYCNFENRLNLDDQNILSILVSGNQPGYHKVQYCSFKNFDGTGNDMGIEPIRIGLSSQANRISRSLVEYCYFTRCNGDGELISSKATQNVYRYNTFENNTFAELVLRHGSEAVVYGNFFINNKGGVRVREGQNHYIYNNYFTRLRDRAIYLQNEDSDPLDSISIAFNTVVDCEELRLGGIGNDKPTNVTFANNIFTDPKDDLFREPTGTETWISNIAFGDLGITLPTSGMTVIDPILLANSEGYWGLDSTSPAIDAAQPGYLPLPQFQGMDAIDADIMSDLMGQNRPDSIPLKDLGCNEWPHAIVIQPIATEANTGPSYDTSAPSNLDEKQVNDGLQFKLYPNPVEGKIHIKILSQYSGTMGVDIYDMSGNKIRSLYQGKAFGGEFELIEEMGDLTAGLYMIHVRFQDKSSLPEKTHSQIFLKN